jgi:hypothetical protein
MLTISDKSAIRLHPLERQVVEKLFTKTDTELSVQEINILEMQFETAIILSRKMTGHGFYTKFLTVKNVPPLPGKQTLWFGAVSADVPGLNHGAGFQLYIEEGAVSLLEGFCYDGHWPDPWPGKYDESVIYNVSDILRS